jgi:hypothetical protein
MTVHKYSPTRARGISEFSTGHGIVAVIAVLAAVMLGVTQWMQPSRGAPSIDSSQQESQVPNPTANSATAAASQLVRDIGYFPSQHVNQAAQTEKHIEAF